MMIKYIIIFLSLFISRIFTLPAQYLICSRYYTQSPPVIDGALSEWGENYFLDSIRSADNIFLRDSSLAWTPSDFQLKAYFCFDDNSVYFGVKITADDVLIKGNPDYYCNDAIWVTPGGRDADFLMSTDGGIHVRPGCPFVLDSTLSAAVNPAGNGPFATAEFSIKRKAIDPNEMGTFLLCVGFQENDLSDRQPDAQYGGIGCEYTGNKQVPSDQWKNPGYYPVFTLGPLCSDCCWGKIEKKHDVMSREILRAFPNPSATKVYLSYEISGDGELAIHDMAGRTVGRYHVRGTGGVTWDAEGLPSGIYVLKAVSGGREYSRKLVLQR